VPREEVVEALWPDDLPTQVDHLLSNAAYYLRRTIRSAVGDDAGIQVMVTAGQRYHLQTGLFRVDADAFEAHLRRAEDLSGQAALVEYERGLAVYKGDFLGNEPYEWASPFRRDYLRRFVEGAQRAARLAFDLRDVQRAAQFYRAILERDPTNEDAARGLMRCYDKLADPNGVRKVYKVLTEALRRELEDENAEPLPDTVALFEELTRKTVQARLLND
jgi:two-component SAPR family response regulator